MTFDLLDAVQPKDGWFCAVGIKGRSIVQKLVQTREELDELAEQFVADKRNAFFAVAKFQTDADRKKDNVQSLKAFWLDIDCGPTKAEVNEKTGRPDGYADQDSGKEALDAFCELVGLPEPILVNSGRGIHVYWALTEEVTREQWEPVAHRLRELCFTHELYVDPAVFEVARVLRVPGTLNFKDDPAKPVSVVQEADPIDFNELRDILGVEDKVETAPKRELTALGQQFADATTNSFKKIMIRSGNGDGCQQLLSCYEDRETLVEPRWFNALSVAKFCTDKDKAIHKLSSDHPDYDPGEVEHKIKHILGPHTCEKFEENNPGGCDGCPFKGKIKSPIVLGREVEKASEMDNIISIEEDGVEEKYKIPEYPFPFFRGKTGGIWYDSANAEEEPVLVYEHDLYVLKRMKDPIKKDVAVFKLHTPHDGVLEFIIPNSQLTEPREVRKLLAEHGVLCGASKKSELLSWYITASVREMQTKKKAELMRLQFGWADNDSKFIIGDREITADGTYHTPPSPSTETFVEHLQKAGSFEKWKEIFSIYGRKGLEPQAFATLCAFGAPIFKYTGQQGALVSLVAEGSGDGKSTVLYMQNSVWGHPKNLTGLKADTMNAKFMRLGVHNNLSVTLDEMTECAPQEVSDLAYGVSQGKWKERMKQSTNELRKNLTNWCTLVTTSANSSFYEALAAAKNRPEAEMMRIIEYKIPTSEEIANDVTSKYKFDIELPENYGHAGDIYAEYLVNNLEEVKAAIRQIQEKVDREFKITQKERFWSAIIAANITGGLIARNLGLIDWDVMRIYQWCGAKLLPELREDVRTPVDDVVAVIGDFINRHLQNILVVNDEVDSRSKMPTLPLMEPRGNLFIRYEPDTKLMYISAKAFKEDCVKYRLNYKGILKDLTKKGILKETTYKRMSKGMKISSPATRALVLDCDNSEFLDVDAMLEVEETVDAGGEGQLRD
jgi:hypothetical protein